MPSPSPGFYRLLDCGEGAKLEAFGPVLLHRPSPQALWSRRLPPERWEQAAAVYHRSSSGGGRWEHRQPLPEEWTVRCGPLLLNVKPTGFGHLGLFAEQAPFWEWIAERSRAGHSLLNLFAYTGGSSLAAAKGGSEVTHVDASRGVVQWASDNARLQGLAEAPIRWIVEDAARFLKRERKRERRYHALVLDPPSFGRGKKGEIFKLERDLPGLLEDGVALLHEEASFLLLSAHTPGVGPLALENLLREALGPRPGAIASGEMVIPIESSQRLLPSGSWAAWSAEGVLPAPESRP